MYPQKEMKQKNLFLVGILKAKKEKSSIRIRSPMYQSQDPDLESQ
jgi:hypothetical protein